MSGTRCGLGGWGGGGGGGDLGGYRRWVKTVTVFARPPASSPARFTIPYLQVWEVDGARWRSVGGGTSGGGGAPKNGDLF